MFVEKVVEKVVAVYFIAVAFLMNYFIKEVLYIGGIGVTYRHLFALVLIVSAFIHFLIQPKMDRAIVAVKSALVYAIPLAVVLVVSMLVWMVDKSSLSTILRGISGCFFYTNWLSCSLAAAAMLYMFGELGIWYYFAALLGANLLMIVQLMATYGVGEYMTEFVNLILSFAENTGDVIVKAEVHELSFCIGAYLLYMVFRPRKKIWFWVLFGIAGFCFLSGFKRIAMLSMAAVVVVRVLIWLISHALPPKGVCRAINILMIIVCVVLILYIYVIHAGLFEALENAGIDTTGRAFVYSQVSQYYEFAPSFIGNGIGYLTYQLNENVSLGVTAVHNDFLQFFIDLGFFGYILWILSMTVLRTSYFGGHNNGDSETAMVSSLLIIYLLIASSTDNTINYPLLTTVIGLLIMGNGFEKKVTLQNSYNKFNQIGMWSR